MKKILSFFIFLLTYSAANAATFVVTSNADSGPGTLRQALLDAAANGSAEKDYINFNLADVSEAGRTIEFPLDLPPLSPDLVINGLTQPGVPFGVSDAKIKLVHGYSGLNGSGQLAFFKGANSGNLSVSGIYFTSKAEYAYIVPALDITNGGDIEFDHCLIELGRIEVLDCKSISVKNSLIGYFPNGSFSNGPDVSSIIVMNTLNSVIGGSPAEGNSVSGYINIVNYRYIGTPTYLISNNKIGTDISGNTSSAKIWTQKERIRIDASSYSNYPYPPVNFATGKILDNVIGNIYSMGIYVSGDGKVDIKGNYLNTNKAETANFDQFAPYDYVHLATAIYILSNAKAVIGGSAPGDANVIANVANPILEQSAGEVVITQNKIYCVGNPNYPDHNIHDLFGNNDATKLPTVKITSIKSTGASGKATPNARVELFYDSKDGECKTCSPRNFLAAVTANAQGDWTFTGNTPQSLIASAILNNQTSYFTSPKIDITKLMIKQPHCGSAGEISGIEFYNAAQAKWVNESGNLVSTDLDIKDLKPGKYKLKIGSATCGAESNWIELTDDQPKIDASQLVVTLPSCNKSGDIKGITASVGTSEQLKYSWKNESGLEVGTTADVLNLPPGKYVLTVLGLTNGCTATYGPVTLTNTTGPNIDQTAAIVTPTNCGQAIGSITGVIATGTGTLRYSWKNAAGTEVATNKDLINQPAGTYILQVTDDTQCGPVRTSAIAINEINGVTIDDSQKQVTKATCQYNDGSIIGIKTTGATIFKWYDSNNTVVANQADLKNVKDGSYYMIASNANGCIAQSAMFIISREAPINWGGTTKNIKDAGCDLNNGSIEVTLQNPPTMLPKSYRWVNKASQQTIGTTPGNTISTKMTGLDMGTYDIYATDQSGCESFLASYLVLRIQKVSVYTNTVIVTDETCDSGNGSIKGVAAAGYAPITYTWTDQAGNIVGTVPNLDNVKEGTYHITIADGTGCTQMLTYTIKNINKIISAPAAGSIQLCSPGNAFLSVPAETGFGYRLYESATASSTIADNVTGKFQVSALQSRSYYVSKYSGNCESARAEVKISVGVGTLSLANTFSPNGDGINDVWRIPNIQNYPNGLVQIFNRSGDLLFSSVGYATPFDGTYKGKPISTGVYYYVINLNSGCSLLSGSLTIVR